MNIQKHFVPKFQSLLAGASLVLAMSISPLMAAPAVEGLISVPSAGTVASTAGELERIVKARGLNVFSVVDHAAGAVSVGMTLRPATLVIFGNPKGGTPLMQCEPSLGLELPLKMLVREDADGKVLIEYNDPRWVVERYHASDCPAVAGVEKLLRSLAAEAGGAQ
jgi:uncharacterized protein (DUF302 family)